MKQKKNGFTLIELLAVIVILAIIALIAVPVILNIIDKANKSAFKDSAYGVLNAAEYFYAASQLELEGPKETVEMDTTDSRLELKGSIPTGKVSITRDGEIAFYVYNDRYCVTKGYKDEDITITEEFETCELPIDEENTGGSGEKTLTDVMVSTTNNCVTSGKCTPEQIATNEGIKVTINVKEGTPKDFYVIADDGNKVTLIMDRNIGTQQAWASEVDYGCGAIGSKCSLNDKGPITILNYLTSQIETENWENIPAIKEYEYKNNPDETGATKQYGYQKLTITNGVGVLTSQDSSTTNLTGTMRARLLTYEEANTLKTNNGGTTPKWLYDYLSSSNTAEKPYGYWFLTAYPSYFIIGRHMNYSGSMTNGYDVYHDANNGARPVIELSK